MLVIFSCKDQTDDKNFQEIVLNDSTKVSLILGDNNKLVCTVNDSISSEWPLRYPVYQFQSGTINDDDDIDIAVGVYKATRYDSIKRNRLFLFQVRDGGIIPLWLGSSVGHPIIDFKVVYDDEGECYIRVLAEEKSDKYLVADYEWYGFGLSLSHYLQREISFEIAKKYLD
ncbi:hypothetical protein [Fulvivirga ligni]|uniref:hypothetical protein n=1 Tax=Fulvivirga ligni TaxID=2904246 RepID=UPI001F1D43EF|nr:hypothetical protein [Fulvivirga ligni]UII19413.1 hypothetical protein LVD16_16360 [Fulvivirga ligni]